MEHKSLSPAYMPPPLLETGDLIIIEHIITPSPNTKRTQIPREWMCLRIPWKNRIKGNTQISVPLEFKCTFVYTATAPGHVELQNDGIIKNFEVFMM